MAPSENARKLIASQSVQKEGATPGSLKRVFIYGINYAPELTGVGRYTGAIGRYLADQGIAVDVVTAPPHYPGWSPRDGFRNRYSVERQSSQRITRCPLILRKEMLGIWRLIAPLSFAATSAPLALWRILTTRPQAVLCVEPTLASAPLALIAAKLVGARTFLHVQDLELDAAFAVGHLKGGKLKRLASFAERKTLAAFDQVVTISYKMRDRLESKGVAGRKLSVIRNWVDIEKIRPLAGDNAYRRELNLPSGTFVVQYAGNIGAKQALDVVLEAAGRLQDIGRIVFVIAGEGPEKARLQAGYGHLPNVLFLGLQPEERLCEFLNLADLHILPQSADAEDLVLPSKLGGMLASGKPCLVMAGPGSELAEFVADAALRVPSGEPQMLSAEIRRVFLGQVAVDAECQKRLTEKLRSDVNLRCFLETLARSVSANEPPVYMGSGQPRLGVERPQPLGPA